jgi:hypothetical protein
MYDGWIGDVEALAPGAGDQLAFLGQLSSADVSAMAVSPAGAPLGAAHLVVDRTDKVNTATILPAGAGFLVAWGASAPSPNDVRAARYDEQLGATTPVTVVSPGVIADAEIPRAAYLAAHATFAFAWFEKRGMNGSDQIWVSLRDAALGEAHAPIFVGAGVAPVIAAGDDDFLIVWRNAALPTQLGAARLAADGTVTPLSVAGTGGTAAAWDIAARNGQPALVWLEAGGSAPNLAFDPLCD